ncbi:Beta-barrel assembly-enhancing protease [Alphaproteobacteria bacterium SO-S41]|nr:Beta-barrel assembly-enhancing protease [Alphaproteobacteria bacterium SO-S41]
MLLWVLFAALTALSAFVVARPFLLRRAVGETPAASAIYRAQLAELRRETEAGQIAATEAEEARREIARRLLSADAAEKRMTGGGLKREAAIGLALCAVVPVAALVLYATLGSPDLPGQALADRDMDAAMQEAPLEEVAEKLFERLAMDPGHPDGWILLARTYSRLGRFDEAAAAYARAIELLGVKAPAGLYSAYGEALTLAAGGRVTSDAKVAFDEALKRDPKDEPARFYLAEYKAQNGDTPGAVADLKALLADTAPDAPQRSLIEAKIAELETPAAKDNPAVRGMVDSLAAKLEANPQDLDGWLLLITSYVKLEEPAKAREALAKARAVFKDDASALEALTAKARELGLEG